MQKITLLSFALIQIMFNVTAQEMIKTRLICPDLHLTNGLVKELFSQKDSYFSRLPNPTPVGETELPSGIKNLIRDYALILADKTRIQLGAREDTVSAILKSNDSYEQKKKNF